jgi:hypothetical protein
MGILAGDRWLISYLSLTVLVSFCARQLGRRSSWHGARINARSFSRANKTGSAPSSGDLNPSASHFASYIVHFAGSA